MENKYNTTPLKRFWNLLRADYKEIRNIYTYAVFNGLISLTLPLGIQAIVNLIQGGQVNASWILLVFVVVLGVAITGVLQIFQLRITENIQQRIFTRAAFEFAYRIPRVRMEALYNKYAPELMNRFFDTVSVQKGLSKILIDFSAAGFQVIFGLLLLSFYHPFFILFSLILLILVFVIFKTTAKKGLERSLDESKYKYEVAHWLEELARVSTTFKLAGKTELPMFRMNDRVENYLASRESHFKVLLQQYSLMVVFKVIVATGLLAIGGILVMEQLMNIGQFIAAEIIILLVMSSVEKLILSLEIIYDVLTAIEKVAQVTDLELEADEGVDLLSEGTEKGLKVEFKNVSFAYPEQKEKVIKDVNLTIESGEVVTVMGKNSSGKSTLLQLMAGLYDASDGRVVINDLPLGNIDLSSLRSLIGDSLLQEQVFEGSLMDNIAMGRADADFENVQWAVENIGLNEFVKSLPKGYGTEIGPFGMKLPRSIAQRILIARCVADKPRLLLIEDSFEHLDQQTRIELIDFLTSKENNWTLVAVSHDPYMASKSNKVLIMEEGKVSHFGTYSELERIIKAQSNA